MRLENIKIENFRCFKSFNTNLAPKVSVLIGKNGAGKTSLVDAISKAISFIFTNSKRVSDHFIAAGNPSLGINTVQPTDFFYDTMSRTIVDKASIKAEAIIGGENVSWELYKNSTKNANLYASRYKNAYVQFMKEYDRTKELPVLSVYSDSYPHRLSKVQDKAMKQFMKPKVMQNYGYYMWDDDTACLSIWLNRLDDILQNKTTLEGKIMHEMHSIDMFSQQYYEDLQKQLAPLKEEVDFLESRLKKFSELTAIDASLDFTVDYLIHQGKGKFSDVYIHFKDGSQKTFDQLPAGFRRIYSIVLDIAYRSFILNGSTEPNGIVIIDEVDMHLHPGLEEKIVSCFTDTFPQIQFILTTHSPLVVSHLDTREKLFDTASGRKVRENAIFFIKANAEQSQSLVDAYGLDFNSSLTDVMGVNGRDQELEQKMAMYLMYKLEDDTESADMVYHEIEQMVGMESMAKIAKELRMRYYEMRG